MGDGDRRKRVALGVIGAVAAVGWWGVVWLVEGPGSFTMRGTVDTVSRTWVDDVCLPYFPHVGDPVTVYDSSGAAVAKGSLSAGHPVPGDRCEYTFTVAGVPEDSSYTVQVGLYGRGVFSRVAAADPRLVVN